MQLCLLGEIKKLIKSPNKDVQYTNETYQGSSVGYQSNCFWNLLSAQSKMVCLPSRNDHVSLPFEFSCFFKYMYIILNKLKCFSIMKNICCFVAICITNDKNI